MWRQGGEAACEKVEARQGLSTEPQCGGEKTQKWGGGWQGPGRERCSKATGGSLSLSVGKTLGESQQSSGSSDSI